MIGKTLKRSALLAALSVGLSVTAGATNAGGGTGAIELLEVTGANFVVVNVTGNMGARPTCHNSGYPASFAFDITSAKGRALLEVLLGAYAIHRRVTVHGAGSCTQVGTNEIIETLSQVF
jgi:hypothetical protein